MTFQRHTALRIASFVKQVCPDVHVVAGGYDPSLAPEAYDASDVDFIVRGEVHWPLAFWLMGGSIPGYFLGATLAQRIPANWVRAIAGAIGIGIAFVLWSR